MTYKLTNVENFICTNAAAAHIPHTNVMADRDRQKMKETVRVILK